MTRSQRFATIAFTLCAMTAGAIATVWSPVSATASVPPASVANHDRKHEPIVRAEGQVVAMPGARVMVSAELAGAVRHVAAHRGEHVQKGQILVELDSREQRAALQESYAQAAEAHANYRLRETERKRTQKLAALGSLPASELDHVNAERNAARARLWAASAASQRLATLFQKQRIVAPIDGVVVARSVEPGEVVAAGAPLLEIVDVANLRVRAEIDEYFVARVKLGLQARIDAEGFSETWSGRLDELGDAIVPRGVRPSDPARPTDVGILPVFVSFTEETPLRLGQRVHVTLANSSADGASAAVSSAR